ncbi:copper chaperone PCu(A)C [Streptomyces sp. NPDC093252]|uniref:copper chaperone PCu(A)C n=1 Tax=Streptomyces sp. NPDC093252 TaxID=3154980 RepID=UPI0034251725
MRLRGRGPGTVLAALLMGGALIAGCGSGSDSGSGASAGPDLAVSAAYMPQPVSDSMAAGFLTVSNRGGEAAELVSVTSDLGEVTVHETVDGRMSEVESLAVPAGGRLELASGGNHLMFEKLTHKPLEGEKVAVKLHFAGIEPVDVEIPVKASTYTPASSRSESSADGSSAGDSSSGGASAGDSSSGGSSSDGSSADHSSGH